MKSEWYEHIGHLGEDDIDEDFGQYVPRARQATKTCNICNTPNLRWVSKDGSWKLADHNRELHVCPPLFREASERGNIKSHKTIPPLPPPPPPPRKKSKDQLNAEIDRLMAKHTTLDAEVVRVLLLAREYFTPS